MLININTRSINDRDYVALDACDSNRQLAYNILNYRLQQTTRNPCYLFPRDHTQYDLQNITEGQGAGMNPNLDSKLTRAHPVPRPADRLAERVGLNYHFEYLPCHQINEFDHQAFLVSTTISDNPQAGYNPNFEIHGIGTRNYGRLPETYIKSYAKDAYK